MDIFCCYPWKLFQQFAMENDEYLPFDYLPINGHPENGVMVGDILG